MSLFSGVGERMLKSESIGEKKKEMWEKISKKNKKEAESKDKKKADRRKEGWKSRDRKTRPKRQNDKAGRGRE